jgi:hypothetical protein
MKIRITLILVLILMGLAIFLFLYIPKPAEKAKVEVDDFLTIPTYTTESSTTSTTYGNSYWFVVGLDKSGVMRNGFYEQNHTYFSYEEAKVALTHDCFITNIVKVDKETYEHNKE